MRKFFTLTIAIFFANILFAQNIIGSWSGVLSVSNTKLQVVFNITQQDSSYTSTMDSPDQGAFGLPTTRTTFADNKLEIVATGLGIYYQGILAGDSIVGSFNQGGISFPLILKKAEKVQFNRPQTPVEPYPYTNEEVIITLKKDNITLSGTLSKPYGDRHHPAIILISGSGPNDRDETIFGHKPFLVLSDFLTRNGFAVIRYDKRGVGKSTGEYNKATIRDFANDAAAVVDFAKSRKDIDPANIHVIGHSEGGLIAAMLASQNPNIRSVVSMAGPGVKGLEIVQDQNRVSMQAQKIEPETIDKLLELNREILQGIMEWHGTENERTTLRNQLGVLWVQLPILVKMKVKKDVFVRNNYNALVMPGYRSFLSIDPAEYWEKTKCPVFAINGEMDTQVLAEKNLSAIRNALTNGNNKNFETKSYPKLNHLFQECTTGYVDEYAKIEQTISPEVLEDILAWLQKQQGESSSRDLRAE